MTTKFTIKQPYTFIEILERASMIAQDGVLDIKRDGGLSISCKNMYLRLDVKSPQVFLYSSGDSNSNPPTFRLAFSDLSILIRALKNAVSICEDRFMAIIQMEIINDGQVCISTSQYQAFIQQCNPRVVGSATRPIDLAKPPETVQTFELDNTRGKDSKIKMIQSSFAMMHDMAQTKIGFGQFKDANIIDWQENLIYAKVFSDVGLSNYSYLEAGRIIQSTPESVSYDVIVNVDCFNLLVRMFSNQVISVNVLTVPALYIHHITELANQQNNKAIITSDLLVSIIK